MSFTKAFVLTTLKASVRETVTALAPFIEYEMVVALTSFTHVRVPSDATSNAE